MDARTTEPVYNAYKGLQKPLVFKSFKGKYIYWGLSILVVSLFLGVILMVTLSLLLGAIAMIGGMVGGLLFIASKQNRNNLVFKTAERNISLCKKVARATSRV